MLTSFTKVMNSLNYSLRYLLFLFVGHLILSSCSDNEELVKVNFFKDKTISLKTKIQKVLETDYLLSLGMNEEQSVWLQEYYSAKKYKPNWINDSLVNEKGLKLNRSLARSAWFGIPENRLKLSAKKKINWVEAEIILTAKTALMLSDLNNGFLNFEEKKYKPENFVSSDYLNAALKVEGKKTYDDLFLSQGPSDTNYRFIVNKLYEFCSSYTLDKSTFEIRTVKLDSIHTISKTKLSLLSKGYLKKADPDSLTFDAALKLFQKHNGLKQDAVIGKYTAVALSESTYSKVLRAALAMDHLRNAIKYPSKCVRINIPEYKLRFYVNDSLKRVHNMIVGKPENQTPQLQSKIRTVVVYPFWKVPYSIASKEILPAAQNNVAYFSRNNFKVYRGDHQVNPHFVNWKKIKKNSFPYTVVQEPGPKNSLGILKFEFHNNYSVYVHDTPTKGLFKKDVRAYSHGCMRCENPIDLAKTILDYDSVGRKRNDLTRDSLDTLLFRAENYKIQLRNPIPIYVEYTTVYADRTEIIFYLDIYKREEEYLKIMRD